jgi:uncharacterized membrane protein
VALSFGARAPYDVRHARRAGEAMSGATRVGSGEWPDERERTGDAMEPTRVEAGQGWTWFVCGWRLFARKPGVMIAFLLVLFVIAIVLNLVPLVGNAVFTLITAVLFGGWYYAIDVLDHDGEIGAGMLFAGFRDKAKTGPLVVLGAFILLSQIVSGLIAVALMGGVSSILQLPDGGAQAAHAGMTAPVMEAGMIVALVLILTIAAVTVMGLLYAVPLVYFHDARPTHAVISSFTACMKNIPALVVFSLVYLGLSLLALIPAGLGFVVLMPVSMCAAYCSYRAIYAE